jgi:hypothetical protein
MITSATHRYHIVEVLRDVALTKIIASPARNSAIDSHTGAVALTNREQEASLLALHSTNHYYKL